jgi:hypothetical protein
VKNNKLNAKVRLKSLLGATAIICGGILAILIGNGSIDSNKLFGFCGFEQSHNIPCPFCGMTRSVCLFVRGDIAGAFNTQPAGAIFSIIVFLALIYLILRSLGMPMAAITKVLRKISTLAVILFIIAVILLGWGISVYRYKYTGL